MANKGKEYEVLVYSYDGTYVGSGSKWEIGNITREINGPAYVEMQTDSLITNLTEGFTSLMNRIKIRIKIPYLTSKGITYFSGYIVSRRLNIRPEALFVNIEVAGNATRLFESLYRNGTTIVMDYTGGSTAKASEIVTDVVDKFQALDSNWPVDYTASSIEDSTDDVEDIFELAIAGEVLNRCIFLAYTSGQPWYWWVDGNDVFYFKKASATADHSFTFGKDVSQFNTFQEDLQQSRNEIYVQYDDGTAPKPVRRRADATSITSYGPRTQIQNENSVTAQSSADKIGDNILQTKDAPVRDIKITVTDDYALGIETIHPGQTCKIKNLPSDIDAAVGENLLITKTVYKFTEIELTLALKDPQPEVELQRLKESLQRNENRGIATTYS
jgi:hypothetical protein